jgi:hypothetical protein
MVLRSPLLPAMPRGPTPTFTSTLWGPTCDSADCVYKDVSLPLLRNGDWLCFPNAGAYTVAGERLSGDGLEVDWPGWGLVVGRVAAYGANPTLGAHCPCCRSPTSTGACDFNGIGMTTPRMFYVFSDHMAGSEPLVLEHEQPEVAESP